MKRIPTVKVDLPTEWAPYILNCDHSGLNQRDIEEIEAAIFRAIGRQSSACLYVSLDSYIGRFGNLQTELSTYTFRAYR